MLPAAEMKNGNALRPKWIAVYNFSRRAPAREFLIFVAFCLLTAVMTWPWVLHLRDAVADRGDPYMIAWTLWSDYHQTFHSPLHIFDANVFYPYKYTLAFSENDYGIALLFFPLFAIGLKPLTVHSIATFLGFAFSGYGAFRLTRTLTGRNGPSWIAGIVFAFIPFRFHVLSHLHYLFAGWIPLMLESLVLFARRTSWQRATWMGIAFLMNALSCISWLLMTIVPLAATVLFLVTAHKSLWRNREFWLRGTVAVAVASLVLIPFLWPYYKVTTLYGLKWQPWEYAYNSPSLIHWLKAETRNKIWQNLGASIPGGHRLFPGLLAPLLAIASLRVSNQVNSRLLIERRLLVMVDFIIVGAAFVAVLALGYGPRIYTLFGRRLFGLTDRTDAAVAVLLIAIVLRIGLSLPGLIRRWRLRQRRSGSRFKIDLLTGYREAIGVGLVWTIAGFLGAMGANFFLNRWLHDYFVLYQSIRIPSRAAMICYLGLAVLAGVGAARLAGLAQKIFSHRYVTSSVIVLIALAVLIELRAAPLNFEKGEVDPSGVALRLRQTPMQGGLVELPSGIGDARHFYMLRAADHARPLVNATSSFISPLTDQINKATDVHIAANFMDLLEQIPASYLIVHNDRLLTSWQTEYEVFLARSLAAGRLRFVNRFDGHDDLYAVVKTEPNAKSEAPAPFPLALHEWAAMIREDQANLLVSPSRAQSLHRIHLATTGRMPLYAEFMKDAERLAKGVILESDDQDQSFNNNLREFVAGWVSREPFTLAFRDLNDEQYVDQLLAHAGIKLESQEQAALVSELSSKRETRADILRKIVGDRRFIEKENYRSLVLLHYFAFLHRNPGEPPDKDLSGFDFWIQDLARERNPAKLSLAFGNSIEYRRNKERK